MIKDIFDELSEQEIADLGNAIADNYTAHGVEVTGVEVEGLSLYYSEDPKDILYRVFYSYEDVRDRFIRTSMFFTAYFNGKCMTDFKEDQPEG